MRKRGSREERYSISSLVLSNYRNYMCICVGSDLFRFSETLIFYFYRSLCWSVFI